MSMTKKICGIDVHKDLLVATILDPQTQHKQTRRFTNSTTDIEQIKNWLTEHQCNKAVMESTGIYWVPLYTTLEAAKFEVILANAHQIKGIPGRKTDQSDSEWLAQLQGAGLIKPSYVPAKQIRELRDLIRLRIKYVQSRTQSKNRVQKILNRINMRLKTVLSDLFGKAGTELLEGLLAGKTVKTILETTENKQLKTKSAEIEAVAQGTLSEIDHFVLEQLIKTINDLTGQIKLIELRIDGLVNRCDLEFVCSVPGVGKLSGATILAELGDVTRFDSDKAVACWCGLAPSVYQSAGVANYGAITKRGSKYLRWCMVEVAHSAVRSDGRFKEMFERISVKKGRKVAYVAVARKLLTIVWHLLVNGEMYVEEGFLKKTVKVRSAVVEPVSLESMIAVLRNAGYVVSGKG